jgi:hypothetical protein
MEHIQPAGRINKITRKKEELGERKEEFKPPITLTDADKKGKINY